MNAPHRCPQCDAEIPPGSPAGLCPRCLLLAANESQSIEVSGPEPTKLTPRESGFVPPTVAELAPLFPQLEIQELLGKGGMGAVYKARQPGLDRLVAVKILPAEISHDPKFIERFQREARALARLSHPHIVAVYDFGQTGGMCYIVMEFVDGANLRQTIHATKLTPAEALAIVPQICDALQFAHDEGIVHRDIKPENILIDKRGRVKIADFGLAKLLGVNSADHSLTATHQVMGTLKYMAPEQMQGAREVDHRADIYSLGVVFYELLTGELPMGKFAPPSRRVQIDVRLDEVVLRALEQNPEERYQHASDVRTELESIRAMPQAATDVAAQPPSQEERRERAPLPAPVGTPLTQIRFTVNDSQDVCRQAVFHFSSLGYQLLEQQPDVCVLQRGRKWAGLWATDIRDVLTQVTIRTTPAGQGVLWVSCDWSCKTFGSWITRRDLANLEAEGRGLESLLGGTMSQENTPSIRPAADVPACPVRRPKLVPLIATFNLLAALALLFLSAMEEPSAFTPTVPRVWRVWGTIDSILDFTMATGVFAASIGLYLWKPWARKVTLAVCVFGLASLVFDAPYLARFVLPDFYAEVLHDLTVEGLEPDLRDVTAFLIVASITVVLVGGGLVWMIGQLIYFTRPQVVAAFTPSNESSRPYLEWLFSGAGAIAGLLSIFGPLVLLVSLSAFLDDGTVTSVKPADTVPKLGTITSGIGAEFTVPAGHVATFEVVTRRDNETVPVPPHCGYVMAPPDHDVGGTFRWSKKPDEDEDEDDPDWSLEILTVGGGRGYSESKLLPEELNKTVGAMSLGMGVLTPNEEVIHWGTADANNLPANGLIGLRVTVVPHGTKSSGSGNAHIDWKKSQSTQSSSRRKLMEVAP